jgi:hypothetical protein
MMGVNYKQAAKNGSTPVFSPVHGARYGALRQCIGPDRNDAVTAMIDWVEKGKSAPPIKASRVVNNQVVHSPLCPIRRLRVIPARAASMTHRTLPARRPETSSPSE